MNEREKLIKKTQFKYLVGKTKREIFESHCNWQSARTTIRRNAVKVFELSDKPKCCQVCKYDKHYEVCHIKSVSSFLDGAKIEEINSVDNLLALCPNCHWEFDNGLLEIAG